MYFLGIDIGAVSAKAVILRGGDLIAMTIMDTGPHVVQVADAVLQRVLKDAQIAFDDLQGTVATGYGRISVPFAGKKITEITCHARGVHHLIPEAKTIIDIGGQDSKGIRLDEEGTVQDFVMNDKCAAGTGRFLEVMAKALNVHIDDLGTISQISRNPCLMSSVCTVFAESEVVSLRAEGRKREDIVAGLHNAIASRISAMISQIGCEDQIVLTGGVAKNRGVLSALEDELQRAVKVPEEPQMTGALGAALFASAGF
jgi:predicted CoA-substrate-specific enzyme activase